MYNQSNQNQPTEREAKLLPTPHSPLPASRAFTLVELLTVVVIISMLAGMSMLALSGTMTAAKESKTRGTIAKLDAAILDIFEGYQERFDNITIDDAKLTAAAGINMSDTGPLTNEQKNTVRALAKLHFISDIMRMEMPSSWGEIINNDGTIKGPIPIGSTTGYHVLRDSSNLQYPPVTKYYHDVYTNYIFGKNHITPESPELLFLIIANLNPEALENFHGSEIGDIDSNGLREFHDAWGNPIQFLRWAPAFPGSDLQPDVVTEFNYLSSNTVNWVDPINDVSYLASGSPDSNLTGLKQNLFNKMLFVVTGNQNDPFDPYHNINRTWFVYPLIFSAGADGRFDGTELKGVDITFQTGPLTSPTIQFSNVDQKITSQNILHPAMFPRGLPVDTDSNGVLNHYDNIHNHRSNNSF